MQSFGGDKVHLGRSKLVVSKIMSLGSMTQSISVSSPSRNLGSNCFNVGTRIFRRGYWPSRPSVRLCANLFQQLQLLY